MRAAFVSVDGSLLPVGGASAGRDDPNVDLAFIGRLSILARFIAAAATVGIRLPDRSTAGRVAEKVARTLRAWLPP